jgi:ABC-2 type transport system ATP-binding protein
MLTCMSIPPTTDQVEHPAIRVRDLEKSFKDLKVLRGVDIDVARGSIFALLGSNGAGKTTLVRILSTLLRADAGTARVNGFDVAAQAVDVRESVSLTGQFAAVDEMSLIGNPPVIFLDEPTTGLDPEARIEVWQAVKELAEGGTTVLLTTQHLDEAEHLADRIAILHEGRIIVDGTLSELKQLLPPAKVEYVEKQPTLEDVFLTLVGAPDGQGTTMNKHFAGDTGVLLGRSLRHITRSPDTVITTAIMPIAFMLLFVYVFGGAIEGT